MAKNPVRNYAVLYLGGKSTVGGAIGGGNVLLNAGQHAIDGPEHTGALDISDLSDVDTVTTPPVDGDVLTWIDADGQWEPLAPTGGGGGGGPTDTEMWRPLMTTSPHVVTTDGLDEWVVLVTATGEAIMVFE